MGTNSRNRRINILEACIHIESVGATTGSGKSVLAHTFLEEVCLGLEGNQFHPRETGLVVDVRTGGGLRTKHFSCAECMHIWLFS